ncbi:MAG: methyltransferase domain-containing protein, partial [Methanobacterium sp.]|uniref:class I SAM-dependent methyltransferase n=1 Tax=Methanobacterium sp. TaxID=2164 RepID=UPI003C7970C9
MMDNMEDITYNLLIDAGIKKGMHILDIGCGRGDVSFLLADMVGIEGSVLGLDLDDNALEIARERASDHVLTNVDFIKSDLNELSIDNRQFDAIVGRRVLMYLPDPRRVISELSAMLKIGGIMIFQESDSTLSSKSIVPMPLHKQVDKWIWDTVEREGGNTHIGFDLWSLLTQKGLIIEKLQAEAVVQTPDKPLPRAMIVKLMLPRIIKTG